MAATRAAHGRGMEDKDDTQDREDTQDRADTADREDTDDSEDNVAREDNVNQLVTEMEGSKQEVAAGYPYQDDIIVINIE